MRREANRARVRPRRPWVFRQQILLNYSWCKLTQHNIRRLCVSVTPRGKAWGQKSSQEEIWPQHPRPPISVSRKLTSNKSGTSAMNPECQSTSELISDTSKNLESFTPRLPKGSGWGRGRQIDREREREGTALQGLGGHSRGVYLLVIGTFIAFLKTIVMVTDGFTFGCSINSLFKKMF